MYYAAAAIGLIGSAWVSRLHTGGYANVLMPAYAAIALLAGLTYARLSAGRHGRIARPLLGVTAALAAEPARTTPSARRSRPPPIAPPGRS